VTRLYVVSEGFTEANFVRDILKPHLEGRWPGRVNVEAPNLRGHHTYAGLKKLILTLLGKPAAEVLVTTMVDLFKLPGDFPGHAACDAFEDPWERVEELEKSFYDDIGDHRLIPYLQLHEFEALILTDVRCLIRFYPDRENELVKLAKSIEKQFKSPEEVNRTTPPSSRIRAVVPQYQKALFGNYAVLDLGIERIRDRCKHFHAWLQRLEALF